MIVVDSSVWIPLFADVETPETRQLESFARSETLLVGDIVMLEVLRGARSDRAASTMEAHMHAYLMVRMLDVDTAALAARYYRQLRALGFTLRSTVDLIIGTYCILHGHALLQRDRDFAAMRDHLGLRLA